MVDIDARDQSADRAVAKFVSIDGRHFLDVVVTVEGHFKLVESRLFDDDEDALSFIAPVSWSGLYSTATDAEREARAVFSWLSDARRLEVADAKRT